MTASLKPIKRVWKPKAPAALMPAQPMFDVFGNDLPTPGVQAKNTALILSTFEALQAAEPEQIAKPKWWK
jgi:hypothetical protein